MTRNSFRTGAWVAVLLAALAGAAIGAESRARMLMAILNLDARQQATVRQVLADAGAEVLPLLEQPRSAERRAAFRAVRERAAARIDAVLTPQQRETMTRVRAACSRRSNARR